MSCTLSRSLAGLFAAGTSRRFCKLRGRRGRHRLWTPEGLESRTLLAATIYTVNATTDTGAGSGTTGDLKYVIGQADANLNAAGNLSISTSIGATLGPVTVPVGIGTSGAASPRHGRAEGAAADRSVPRAEVRLAGRRRVRHLAALSKPTVIGPS